MTEGDPLTQAAKLPPGARFYRCALQVNSSSYAASYRGQGHRLDAGQYVQQIFAQCAEQGIEVIAVTDHNHVGAVDLFRAEGEKHGVIVFPGFELTSSDGVHVLCLYSPGEPTDKLERYLGEFGIRDPEQNSALAGSSFSEILGRVRDHGGITVAAHVTGDKGLLTSLQGQARVRAWKDANLLAVQIPGRLDDLPVDVSRIVRNQDPAYRRDPAAAQGLAVAALNAKDVAKPADLQRPEASCFIKMSSVTIEGLRQAFLDPQSRLRLATDPPVEQHAAVEAIAWQAGFLDGVAIRFNEGLNVLVGGRGAGKSTVVESLRYGLGLEPLGEDARAAHQSIVRGVLRSGTTVSILLRSCRPDERRYRVERTVPNPLTVKSDAGELLSVSPGELIPGIEVYGQHEISELAKNPEKRTQLLERFVERDPSVHRRRSELARELERSRSRLLEAQSELRQIEDGLSSLPSLEETLKRYRETGLEDLLNDQSLIVREEGVLKTALERLVPLRQLADRLHKALPIDRAFLGTKALEPLPGRATLAQADGVLSELDGKAALATKQLETAIDEASAALRGVESRWQARKAAVQATYERILRDLQKSKIDGEEYIRLRRRIEDLRPLRERREALLREVREHDELRRRLLDEWQHVRTQDFQRIERAARKVTLQLEGRVRVSVAFEGNRDPLLDLLRTAVPGRLQETIDTLKGMAALSLVALAQACRSGKAALRQQFGLTEVQAERLAQAPPETIMRIEELDLPPTTALELNVAQEDQDASWQALDALSTGQKATAILLLLLLESDAPLIVDQPEDDLDNRFITEGVVPIMREEKRHRQFIFATHNANIPVLGDAEQIAGLQAEGEGGRGRASIPTKHVGSIDSPSVRELVEEVLEGGKAAFEMRRRKYRY